MLNKAQRRVVDDPSPNKVIIAGPGTGKTSTITELIKKDVERGVYPDQMVAITFTRNASMELKERLQKIGVDTARMYTGTIHAYALNILVDNHELINRLENFQLYDQDDEKDIKLSIIKEFGFKVKHTKKKGFEGNDLKVLDKEYEDRMMQYNAISIGSILPKCTELLETHTDVLDAVREVNKYFYIDEFQDSNDEQINLIKLLDPDRLTIIGDPDQSIYEWNMAKPEYLVNHHDHFPGMAEHKLEINYRSGKGIVTCANNLISYNDNRIDKDIITDKEGKCPTCFTEAEGINELERIYELITEPYRDNAIICRSNRTAMKTIEYLASRKIPINNMLTAQDIFKKPNIKDFIKVLALINNTTDNYAFDRATNYLCEGFKSKPMPLITESLYNHYEQNLRLLGYGYIYDIISEVKADINILSTSDIIKTVLNDMGIKANYMQQGRTTRIKELEMFLDEVKRWEYKNNLYNYSCDIKNFLRYIFLRDVSELKKDDVDAVRVMTVHGSKGLEFPNVIIPDFNDGVYPSKRSENIEEERRLMFVALTRAKEQVSFTRANKVVTQWGPVHDTIVSRFEEEMQYRRVM